MGVGEGGVESVMGCDLRVGCAYYNRYPFLDCDYH